jgi:hypothetical protein
MSAQHEAEPEEARAAEPTIEQELAQLTHQRHEASEVAGRLTSSHETTQAQVRQTVAAAALESHIHLGYN